MPAPAAALRAVFLCLGLAACAGAPGEVARGPAPAARPACDTIEGVDEVLREAYRESRRALGVAASGGLIQVYTSPRGATWTILVTAPSGWTCLLAAGRGWRQVAPEIEGPEA